MLPSDLYPVKPFSVFLDSLDTVRYNEEDIQSRESQLSRNLLHAKLDIVCTLLSGNIITISEPQLFDSLGFLSLFSEMIEAINDKEVKNETPKKMGVKLPIRISLRDPGDNVWRTVAKLMKRTKGSGEYFKLSGWPALDLDDPRRERWAEALEKGERVKDGDILDEERPWYDKLDRLLRYIDYPDVNCYGQVEAAQIPNKYGAEINQVASLDEAKTMKMLYPQPEPSNPLFTQPIWLRTEEEADAALLIAEIVKLLQEKYQVILNRTIVYDANLDRKTIFAIEDILNTERFSHFSQNDIVAIRHGLLELADGVYNEVVGLSSNSDLIGNSRFRDPSGIFANAANSLARWARETNDISNREYHFSIPWGLIVEDKLAITHNKNLSESVSTSLKNLDWKVLLKTIIDKEWKTSITGMKKRLETWQRLEKEFFEGPARDERLQKEVEMAKSAFDTSWDYHMHLTETLLKKHGHSSAPILDLSDAEVSGLSLKFGPKAINSFITTLNTEKKNKEHDNEISSLISQITPRVLDAVVLHTS